MKSVKKYISIIILILLLSNLFPNIVTNADDRLTKTPLANITCIDNPTNNKTFSGYSLSVSGWALSAKEIDRINVYIDNKLIGIAQYGIERLDVARIYSTYNNPNSGYSGTFDISNISNGNKVLKVEQVAKDGSKSSLAKNIIIKKSSPRIVIDNPKSNVINEGNELTVSGWMLSSKAIKNINLYIDNKLMGTADYGIARPDVARAYPEYNNANSGFRGTIDVSNISAGTKILKVELTLSDNTKTSITRKIYVNGIEAKLCIDNPTNNRIIRGHSLTVSGWVLNTKEIDKINVYLDNKLIGIADYGIARPDVAKVYPEYNKVNTGYCSTFDLSDISNGNKVLKVEQVAEDGSIVSITKDVVISKSSPKITIDNPKVNSSVEGNQLTVSGWTLSSKPITNINLYIDNKLMGTADYGIARPDVAKVYPEYNNANSGYKGTIDISTMSNGIKTLKVELTLSDNTKTSVTRKINVSSIKARTNIDSPRENGLVSSEKLIIRGWALNIKEIDKINIYLDNEFKGTAEYGLARADVARVYPGYNNANSGFSAIIDISNIANGTKILKVEQVAKDGTTFNVTRKIKFTTLKPMTCIDNPSNKEVEGNKLTVSGWALNKKSISKINIYLDNKFKGTAEYGKSRPDVANVHPEYNNFYSGYIGTIDIDDVSAGTKTLKVEQISSDGSKTVVTKKVNISKITARTCIDYPVINSRYYSNELTVRGWAVNKKSISKINIYVDNALKGTTSCEISRSDVARVYPGYNNALNSGYSATIDISNIELGVRTIKVEQIASDGSKSSVTTKIVKIKDNPIITLDVPTKDKHIAYNSNLTLSGWALNKSKVQKVNVYIDNVYIQSIGVGKSRSDVARLYPNFSEASNSGFSTTISLKKYASGAHTVKIEAIGTDGTKATVSRRFYYGKRIVVVVDAGHNYGGDEGAVRTFNGVTYYERDLNMKMAAYLKGYLEEQGYSVVMTRNSSDRDKCSTKQSLSNRVKIANSSKANVFISIHNNTFTSSAAHGVEVYYYNSNNSRATQSKALATSVVNNIAASTGFYNRGVKTADFYVTKNTTMPSILVEGGFMSNNSNMTELAKDSVQRQIAKAICNGVVSNFR